MRFRHISVIPITFVPATDSTSNKARWQACLNFYCAVAALTAGRPQAKKFHPVHVSASLSMNAVHKYSTASSSWHASSCCAAGARACLCSPRSTPWLILLNGTLTSESTFVAWSDGAWHALPVLQFLDVSLAYSLLPEATGPCSAWAQASLQSGDPEEGLHGSNLCLHAGASYACSSPRDCCVQAPLPGISLSCPADNMLSCRP